MRGVESHRGLYRWERVVVLAPYLIGRRDMMTFNISSGRLLVGENEHLWDTGIPTTIGEERSCTKSRSSDQCEGIFYPGSGHADA